MHAPAANKVELNTGLLLFKPATAEEQYIKKLLELAPDKIKRVFAFAAFFFFFHAFFEY